MTAKDRRQRYRNGVELLAVLEPRLPSASSPSIAVERLLPAEDPTQPTVLIPTMELSRRDRSPTGLRQWLSNAMAKARNWLDR
jgi:hypothetical protein